MIYKQAIMEREQLRAAIDNAYRMNENECVEFLLEKAALPEATVTKIQDRARGLIAHLREAQKNSKSIETFLHEYELSSEEGIALMCLAEALLRVPDKKTIDELIRDKLTQADWKSHINQNHSFFVNATNYALMLTGNVLNKNKQQKSSLVQHLKNLLARSSEPLIRGAVGRAMKILSRQFVMGRTIEEAIKRGHSKDKKAYRYSYDMLGEAARTAADAERYFKAYQKSLTVIAASAEQLGGIEGPGISVKLSALHPRYEFAQRERVLEEVVPKLFTLARYAKQLNIALTVDAEEADRLDLSLDIIEAVFDDPALDGWEGFGVAVQCYQKRAWYVLDYLAALARRARRRIKIRLIKGAYWDTEIKQSQMLGLSGYPVFTRKESTDVSFQACAKKILAMPDAFYPQFATHNAYSVALILELVGQRTDFEFQCLHGMGQALYDKLVSELGIACRVYAPVGSHEDLLPYLVRRLLENGANTSFVNRIIAANAPLDDLLIDPVAKIKNLADKTHPKIPLPNDIFGEQRKNSHGIDFTHYREINDLSVALQEASHKAWSVAPIISGHEHIAQGRDIYSPIDRHIKIGHVRDASEDDIENALRAAENAHFDWDAVPATQRADYLEKCADLLEKHRSELMALVILEAGKTLPDALAEVREAVDYCRYYAVQARQHFATPEKLCGYTGETNSVSLHGRGTIICISPWNFPLAIFIGQVSACLAAGNSVIAKPAGQTPLIAGLAVRLLHAAGIPGDVLHLLPGSGAAVGGALIADNRINGVLFTGSTKTARFINKILAKRKGALIPLIAETGGQNAMIVDSSALLEQVVVDVMQSAFGSAGQRCSALRVLYLQEDIADKFIILLKGAMTELTVGDPRLLSTDVGPVIDKEAQRILLAHIQQMQEAQATIICSAALLVDNKKGLFVAPTVIEITSMNQLSKEVFGPVLHLIRYSSANLDSIIDEINYSGYGLTLGIASRIDATIEHIQQRIRAGNCYVNRNMIGAVVGVQPFGGAGLSGTGPKAGGSHYLLRLCTERTLTINTTAAGGNASLLCLE